MFAGLLTKSDRKQGPGSGLHFCRASAAAELTALMCVGDPSPIAFATAPILCYFLTWTTFIPLSLELALGSPFVVHLTHPLCLF